MPDYSSGSQFREGDVSYDIKSHHSQWQRPNEGGWGWRIIMVTIPGLTPLSVDDRVLTGSIGMFPHTIYKNNTTVSTWKYFIYIPCFSTASAWMWTPPTDWAIIMTKNFFSEYLEDYFLVFETLFGSPKLTQLSLALKALHLPLDVTKHLSSLFSYSSVT